MAKVDFINQLQESDFEPREIAPDKVCFSYRIPVGRNIGKEVLIGFIISDDFPVNCPTGPHFKSGGIDGWIEPTQNIHASPFGSEWRYWSRPFKEWSRTDKTAKVYLSHIKNLLMKV